MDVDTSIGKIRQPIFHFVKMENVIVDVLHMYIRITEKLVTLLLRKLEELDKSSRTKPNVAKFKSFLESLGIRKPFIVDKSGTVMRDLNGVEKIRLFESIDLENLFPEMPQAKEQSDLLKSFHHIISEVKAGVLKPEEIQEKTSAWYTSLISLNSAKEITPYFHIFKAHLHTQVTYLNTLGIQFNSFSMQGLEKQNDCLTQYFQRATNKRDDSILQIIKKRTRIELLTFNSSLMTSFQERRRAKKSSQESEAANDDENNADLVEERFDEIEEVEMC